MYEHDLQVIQNQNHLEVILDGEIIDIREVNLNYPMSVADMQFELYRQYSEYYNVA